MSAIEGPAGFPVTMVRPDLEAIPRFPFPPGFSIRPMAADEVDLWVDIQRDAEEYFPISRDTFHASFGSDLPAVPERCFFVTAPGGEAVGTISAWYDPHFRGQDYGRIHWVAVRPAFRRRGLAKAALSFALRELRRRHDRCYLDTQTKRTAAIALYLKWGFLPDLEEDDAPRRWGLVVEALDDPALAAAFRPRPY